MSEFAQDKGGWLGGDGRSSLWKDTWTDLSTDTWTDLWTDT